MLHGENRDTINTEFLLTVFTVRPGTCTSPTKHGNKGDIPYVF
ncbi:hypothetical protein HMPREF9374_1687 [Desmospora sp. 8437]|nr:hypothetical protein HMPREF9374_1687 [Desmospora sp. 8437]